MQRVFWTRAIYECGCFDIPEGDCDCDGNQLDALGVCGGPCEADVDGGGVCDVDEVFGCTDPVHATLNRERLKKMVLVQKSTNVGSAEEQALPLASAIVTATFWTNVAFVAVKELSLARAIATATCLTNVAFVVAMGAIVLAAWKKVRATTTLMCCSRMGHANT